MVEKDKFVDLLKEFLEFLTDHKRVYYRSYDYYEDGYSSHGLDVMEKQSKELMKLYFSVEDSLKKTDPKFDADDYRAAIGLQVHHGKITCLEEMIENLTFLVAKLESGESSVLTIVENKEEYISQKRIDSIASLEHDASKLIQICKEMNLAYQNECWYTVGILNRVIIDHVPSAFGRPNFSEVVNNFKFSSSRKKNLDRLNTAAKNIADDIVHQQLEKVEEGALKQTVYFAPDIDVLLQETVKSLKAGNFAVIKKEKQKTKSKKKPETNQSDGVPLCPNCLDQGRNIKMSPIGATFRKMLGANWECSKCKYRSLK